MSSSPRPPGQGASTPPRGYSGDPRMSQEYRMSHQDPRLSRPSSSHLVYYQQQRQSMTAGNAMRGTPAPRPPPPHNRQRQSPQLQQQYHQQPGMPRPPAPVDDNHHHYRRSQDPHRLQQRMPIAHGPGRPASRPPPAQYSANRQNSLGRSRSLTRPERQRPRQGMINRAPSNGRPYGPGGPMGPPGPPGSNPNMRQSMSNPLQQQLHQRKIQQQRAAGLTSGPPGGQRQVPLQEKQDDEDIEKPKVRTTFWAWFAFFSTCCFPSWVIKVVFRKTNPLMQQAWREKVTLVYIILILCGALAYITYGFNVTLCPDSVQNFPYSAVVSGERLTVYRENPRVFGEIYDMDTLKSFFSSKGLNLTNDYQNVELGSIFNGDTSGACQVFDTGKAINTRGVCKVDNPYGGAISKPDGTCLSLAELQAFASPIGTIGFDWVDLRPSGVDKLGETDLVVLGSSVLNLTKYINGKVHHFGDAVDAALRNNRGNDASIAVLSNAGKDARDCLIARYRVGVMETETGGCIANNIVMNIMFAVIIAIIVVRYSMALLFQWIISPRLVKPGGRSNWLAWRSIKGGNDDPANHIPGPYNNYGPMNGAGGSATTVSSGSSSRGGSEQNSAVDLGGSRSDIVSTELYSIMLVTCYSEGEDGLRTTMDSLAETTYSKKHKCFFVIADGIITGAGESKSTPDIVVGMMDLDPTMNNPKPCSYLAVADGEKQLNMAKVYAGHYKGVPCVTIVKCGTEEEQKGPKPGNRGKRDSQLILMSFFQRVLFNDRLSELDYEIFWKMTWLMKGVTPDKFELVLMVDADTKVLPSALTYMVAAMANDITIMGLCGETRIANKRASWVTAIQVFEYYISHHYAKAFESLFGIVTCLPGCFSMFRIKAPKNGSWVPLLANPDIILEYNQNVVNTLHEKNLLLLGEDRFLSTLMLRTFPKRQMMFVPQARCRTVVPDEFKVLLSQRRRWINSTIHNLMELVLVSDLCGIACLSMQFSIFVDLVAALVLPAAICMTIYLVISSAVSADPQWQSLALLICILFLPGILIGITTFKLVYILWMLVYIVALPIWNFVLPVYSFWHFDDFSWGATRLVEGEKKDKGHGGAEGKFDSSRLVMKKWEDWESERTGQKVNRNKFSLKTPMDPPLAFDGKSTVTPITPAFGNIFNDRKMFTSSVSLGSNNGLGASSISTTPSPQSPASGR
ncbi:chitin synthase-domain-containing protein [Dichotomocladium elegans]|nr:chitin synthase-domain-containing protein [Dichotomocladium elegans]